TTTHHTVWHVRCPLPQLSEQSRWTAGTRAHLCAQQCRYVRGSAAVYEIPDVLLRREPHHHPEPVPPRGIEERGGRRRVGNADRVEAGGRDLRQVALHHGEVVILAPLGVRLERAVGHAPHVELLVTDEQELAARAHARGVDGPIARYSLWREGR